MSTLLERTAPAVTGSGCVVIGAGIGTDCTGGAGGTVDAGAYVAVTGGGGGGGVCAGAGCATGAGGAGGVITGGGGGGVIGLLWFSIDKLGSLPNTFVAACNLRAASTCSGVKAGGGVCTGGGGGGGVATGLSDSFTAVSAFSSTACLSSSVTITGGGGGAGSVLGSARA